MFEHEFQLMISLGHRKKTEHFLIAFRDFTEFLVYTVIQMWGDEEIYELLIDIMIQLYNRLQLQVKIKSVFKPYRYESY